MDISDILSSISDEDMNKLKKTAEGLLGNMNAGGAAAASPLADIDPKMLESVGKVAGLFRQNDPRCDLLIALKPLLSGPRRERIDEAVQMMRMVSVLPRILNMRGNGNI